jgi:hypothetical protein
MNINDMKDTEQQLVTKQQMNVRREGQSGCFVLYPVDNFISFHSSLSVSQELSSEIEGEVTQFSFLHFSHLQTSRRSRKSGA